MKPAMMGTGTQVMAAATIVSCRAVVTGCSKPAKAAMTVMPKPEMPAPPTVRRPVAAMVFGEWIES